MNLKSIVASIALKDLMDKTICYRCIASGLGFIESMHPYSDMKPSQSTNNLICPHCYDTELDLGYRRMGKKESEKVWALIKEFEKYKNCHLNKK